MSLTSYQTILRDSMRLVTELRLASQFGFALTVAKQLQTFVATNCALDSEDFNHVYALVKVLKSEVKHNEGVYR